MGASLRNRVNPYSSDHITFFKESNLYAPLQIEAFFFRLASLICVLKPKQLYSPNPLEFSSHYAPGNTFFKIMTIQDHFLTTVLPRRWQLMHGSWFMRWTVLDPIWVVSAISIVVSCLMQASNSTLLKQSNIFSRTTQNVFRHGCNENE